MVLTWDVFCHLKIPYEGHSVNLTTNNFIHFYYKLVANTQTSYLSKVRMPFFSINSYILWWNRRCKAKIFFCILNNINLLYSWYCNNFCNSYKNISHYTLVTKFKKINTSPSPRPSTTKKNIWNQCNWNIPKK